MINNANWRGTVEVLRQLGLLDGARLQTLQTAWLGEQITQEEARAIGNALVARPLSAVDWIRRVFPPSRYFRDAHGNFRDYDKETHWPSWLRAFAEFCL